MAYVFTIGYVFDVRVRVCALGRFRLSFLEKKLHRRFPAMGCYLALHVASTPVLLVLYYGQPRHWFTIFASTYYFYIYWAVYIASAVLLFFICIEVFRSALSSFSGLAEAGNVAFRWAALVSVIVSFSTLSFDAAAHLYHRRLSLIG